LLVLLIYTTSTVGQEQGNFNIRNYNPKEYNAFVQNWAAIQDDRGVMYFANGDGILKFDGADWQVIKTASNSAVRSMAKDQSGLIFVGAIGDFGYLQQGMKGTTNYISLSDKLNEEDRNFLEVWFTQTIGNDAYFCTYNTLFRFHNGTIKTWKTKETFLGCFTFNDQLFIYEYNSGLKIVTEDSLVLIPHGDFFKDKPFRLAIPLETNKLLIATTGFGLFLYDFNVSTGQKASTITKFTSELDGIISKSYPYNGAKLKDGNIALCLVPFGLAIVDKNGKRIQFLNKESGLQTESVTNVFEDAERNLWLTLTKGISKIDINSPITSWSDKDGFELINDIIRYNNTLYLGCLNGLFCLKNNKFIGVHNYGLPIFSLLKFNLPTDSSKQILLGGTEFDGIIQIKEDRIVPLLSCRSVSYTMFQSKRDPSYLYIGQSGFLEIARYKNGLFRHVGFVEGIGCEVRNIAEEADGTIWCSNQINMVVCLKPSGNIIKPKKVIEFKKDEGVMGNHDLFNHHGRIVIGTESGIRSLNDERNQFIPDSSFGREYSDGTISRIGFNEAEKTGETWILGLKSKRFGIGLKNVTGKFDWFQTPFNPLPDNILPSTYIEADSTFWISTNEELYRFKGELIRHTPNYQTNIKRVISGKDSILYSDGDNLISNELLKGKVLLPCRLEYKYNSVTFSFTALTFHNESSMLFQTYLEGFDGEWSDWSKDLKKEYTNLAEGSYRFHVRAKNLYDTIGQEANYDFTIMPPWYRTVWAYILYFVLFVGTIILTIKVYTKSLKTANIRLERIVNQRTLEIKKQRDELLVLNSTKDKFFSIIAHDLRNPFNSILGFSELILSKLNKGDVKTSLDFMQILHKTSATAYELLDNLLTWSRSQSGIIQFNPETINIKKQIDYNIILFEGSARMKGITLTSRRSSDIFVFADINMVLSILRNLITNAIKFSHEGDSVVVDAIEKGSLIEISIRDTGIGLDDTTIKKLFKVEEHVKTEGTAKEPGTGLGLILCKEFVEKNYGTIWVESTLGKGSCFFFTLPKANKG